MDTFYSDPNSDAAKLQAKARWHRQGHITKPVVIIDMIDPSTLDEHLARVLLAKRAAVLPFIQGMSAELTPLPPPLLEFKQERQNLPWKPAE